VSVVAFSTAFALSQSISPLISVSINRHVFFRVVNDLLSNIADDLPPVETLSHLHGLGLECTGGVFNGITGERIAWLAPQEKRPLIRTDREVLRQWLCTNVNIEWNKRFDHYEETESGITVYFDDGTSASGDILVGADGGKSHGKFT
jgi:hypothetical protein